MTTSTGRLEALIDKYRLNDYKTRLVDSAQKSVGLRPEKNDDNKIVIGASKLGGKPDLPESYQWPVNGEQPLTFLCQINCADLYSQIKETVLPKSGLLSFFYDDHVWGYEPGDNLGFRALYFESLDTLKRTAPPVMQPRKVLFGLIKKEQKVKEYGSCSLSFATFLSLPDDSEELAIKDDGDCDNYYDMLEELGFHHRLLGYSEPIQQPMELDCELVTNGISCGTTVNCPDEQMEKYKKASDSWKLLLQLDSDCENSDMMWGDAGRVYFWIKDTDLRDRNFQAAWLVFQCH